MNQKSSPVMEALGKGPDGKLRRAPNVSRVGSRPGMPRPQKQHNAEATQRCGGGGDAEAGTAAFINCSDQSRGRRHEVPRLR